MTALSLFDHWRDGYKTLHGMTSRGFPNQFHTGFIQGGVSANTTAMFEQQAEHIAYIISEAVSARRRPSSRASRPRTAGCNTIKEFAIDTSAFDCPALRAITTTRATDSAKVVRSFLGDYYMAGFYAFDDLLKEWRDKGDLDGLELGK